MTVLAAVASALLLLEFGMAVAGFLLGLLDRFTALTGYGRRAGAVVAVVDAVGVAAVAAGFAVRPLSILGAVLLGGVCGFVLVRQVQRGQRGRDLFAYSLFLSWAVLLLVARIVG